MNTTRNQSLPANCCDPIQPSSPVAQSLLTSAAPVRQWRLGLRIFAASAIAVLTAWSASAATIFVDPSGVAPNDGTAWATAFTNLQDALAVAASGDQIWVAQGTYYPDEGGASTPDDRDATFNLIDGVALYGGFPTNGGDGTFAARDYPAYPTILSGDLLQDDGPDFTNRTDNARSVLTANSDVTPAAILDGFTITAGYDVRVGWGIPPGLGGGLLCQAASPSLANCSFLGNFADRGGAIYNSDASPSLDNCSFLGNRVTFYGGAVFNYNSSPSFTRCSFEGNSVTGPGGAVFNAGSSPAFTDCIFNNNSAGGGGAMFNTGGNYWGTGYSSPTLVNCSFQGNSARISGGAIYNEEFTSLTLAHCAFQGNSATGDCGVGLPLRYPSHGGAIYSEHDSSTSLTYCSFSENTAGCRGGAIHLEFSSLTALSHCSFSGNSASHGGAVSSFSSSPTFTNCSFVGNSAYTSGRSFGGAVSMAGAASDVFVNCLFQGNSADYGGGVSWSGYTSNSFTLFNCTLTGNTADESGGGAYGGTFYNCILYFNSAPLGANYYDVTYSPISLNYTCTTPLPSNGVGNITNAPLFVNTNDWSDLRLRYGSPGIDAGTNLSALLTTDLDGNPRPLDGDGDGLAAFDMGAYEFDARSIIPPEWFTRHGLDANDPHVVSGNPDHDAFTTFQEWLAGTDPTNALSFFHIEAISKESPATVSFLSSSNRTYTLWSTPQLVSPDWAVVPGQETVPGNGGTLTLSDPTNALRQFYRVEVSLP